MLTPEHIIGHGRVAGQAIRRAGIIPRLRAHAGGVGDEDVFVQAGGQQIGIAVVRAPFVSHAIDRAVDVAHEQPRFQSAHGHAGIGFIDDEIKIFHEHRAGRECPRIGGRKGDLFVGRDESAVVGHGQVTAFHRAIRPQRRVGRVRNQSAGRRAIGCVGKRAGPESNGGSEPLKVLGMFRNGCTGLLLARPYGSPLPALTEMSTGADVLLNPLPSVATAVMA